MYDNPYFSKRISPINRITEFSYNVNALKPRYIARAAHRDK